MDADRQKDRPSRSRRQPGQRGPTGERWVYWRRRAVPVLALVALAAVLLGIRSGSSDPDPVSADTNSGPTLAERNLARERRKVREDEAIDELLGFTPFIKKGGGAKRQVALTFDDGPGPYTRPILRILKRTHTPATFFEVGSVVPGSNAIIKSQMLHGHAIGNHTEDHAHMGQLSTDLQIEQIRGQASAMAAAGGPAERLFRPPYGSYDSNTLGLLAERRLLMVLWSVDTADYEGLGTDEIARRALEGAEPGAIILMHDGGGDRSETVEALPRIIKGLRKRNLRPVTVPHMVLTDPPPHNQQLPDVTIAG